jgi:hypothetical protein
VYWFIPFWRFILYLILLLLMRYFKLNFWLQGSIFFCRVSIIFKDHGKSVKKSYLSSMSLIQSVLLKECLRKWPLLELFVLILTYNRSKCKWVFKYLIKVYWRRSVRGICIFLFSGSLLLITIFLVSHLLG